jgi:hypothetical protein
MFMRPVVFVQVRDAEVVLMVMDVRMGHGLGTAEELARLMWREVSDYGFTWYKLVRNSLKRMGLHHRIHDLLIYRQRYINAGTLHNSRPMLIAEGVSKFQAGATE